MGLRLIVAVSILFSILVSCGPSEPEDAVPPQEQETAASEETLPTPPAGTREDPFVGRGTIRAIQAEQHQVLIQHEDIPGFMSAMMMVFPVDPATSIDGLETGDSVNFNVERVGDNQYQIFDIREEAVDGGEAEPE